MSAQYNFSEIDVDVGIGETTPNLPLNHTRNQATSLSSYDYHKQQASIGPHAQPIHILPHYLYTIPQQERDQLVPDTFPEILGRKTDRIVSKDDFGKMRKLNECEYYNQWCWLQYKPAFDFDWKFDEEEKLPTDANIQEIQDFLARELPLAYKNDANVFRVIFGWRKTARKPSKKTIWKASLRAYIVGLHATCAHTLVVVKALEQKLMRHPDLPAWVKRFYQEDRNKAETLFDPTIYDHNSKLNCMGCSKGYAPGIKEKDSRILLPRPPYAEEPFENFLIQHISEDSQVAVAADETVELAARKSIELLLLSEATRELDTSTRKRVAGTEMNSMDALSDIALTLEVKNVFPEVSECTFGIEKQVSGCICLPITSLHCILCEKDHDHPKTCVMISANRISYKCKAATGVHITRSRETPTSSGEPQLKKCRLTKDDSEALSSADITADITLDNEDDDEDSEDGENNSEAKTKKSKDGEKSDHKSSKKALKAKADAEDLLLYSPVNYHGGEEACRELVKKHTGLDVKVVKMESKENHVFFNLGSCRNGSSDCSAKKEGGYGTWIRLTRTEIQLACYGKDHGLGCSNRPEHISLLTEEEEQARALLGLVLERKYTTADHDAAQIVHELNPKLVERVDSFFLICGEDNTWQLTNKPEASDLHIRVKRVLDNYLTEYKDRYLAWAPNQDSRYNLRDNKIPHMQKFIKTVTCCRQVATVVANLGIKDPNLTRKILRESESFVAFSDGKKVDLRTGEASEIEPKDYILKTTGYPMPKTSNPQIRKDIMHYLNTSLRIEQVPYTLKELALALLGANHKERILICKGLEGGGKTLLLWLLQGAFGGYAAILGLHVLTKDAGSQDATNSQMFDLFGARLVSVSEPGQNDVVIASRLKCLTSEEIKARTLFGGNLTFLSVALILIMTNYALRYSDMEGMLRRVRVNEFPYQFKDEQSAVNEANLNRAEGAPEVRLARLSFKKDFKKPAFIAEFMLILLETYDQYFSDRANNPNWSIDEPASVHNYTFETMNETCNEGVVEFVEQHIEFKGSENTHRISKGELLIAYQERFRKSAKRIPLGKKNFYTEIQRLNIKEKKIENSWYFTGKGTGIVLKAIPVNSYGDACR